MRLVKICRGGCGNKPAMYMEGGNIFSYFMKLTFMKYINVFYINLYKFI